MSSLEFVGKFIGADEIASVDVSEHTTPNGSKLINILFKSGKSKLFPEKVLPYIITDKLSDASQLQERRTMPALRECVSILMEYDLDYGDIESFAKQLFSNLQLQYDRAENYMWKKNDVEFVPGFDARYGVSLLDAYRVLEGISSNKEIVKDDQSDSKHS